MQQPLSQPISKLIEPIQNMMPLVPMDGVAVSLVPWVTPMITGREIMSTNDKMMMSITLGVVHFLLHDPVSRIRAPQF